MTITASVHWLPRCVFCGVVFLFTMSLSGQESEKKMPVPAETSQAEALKVATEVYGDEWAKAKTLANKQALATKLLEKAKDTRDDPACQFVLLKLARDIATQAMDGAMAFRALDEMGELFQVEVVALKADVLRKVSSAARAVAQHKVIAEQALKLIEVAVSQDDLKTAKELAELARGEARKASDVGLISKAQRRIVEVTETAKTYEEATAASVTLKGKPDDPEANLIMGKYLCYIKGHWDKGLPLLALGNEVALKALAKQELDGPASSNEQAKLGDGWWALAEKEEGVARRQLHGRAGYWYQKALPGLSGLTKDKAEKRVRQAIAEGLVDSPTQSSDQAVYYLADLKARTWRSSGSRDGTSPQEAAMKFQLRGKQLTRGLWAPPPQDNASSHIVFDLGGKYRKLSGTCAIADSTIEGGARDSHANPLLTFRIVGDGQPLWKSRPIRKDNSEQFQIDVAGVKTLELFVDCPGSSRSTWATWVEPILNK